MNYNERLSGNEAIAFAMKQIDPDVMAAFPITPSTCSGWYSPTNCLTESAFHLRFLESFICQRQALVC